MACDVSPVAMFVYWTFYKFHNFDPRDHPFHASPILAGMWGSVRDTTTEFKSFQQSLTNLFEEVRQNFFILWFRYHLKTELHMLRQKKFQDHHLHKGRNKNVFFLWKTVITEEGVPYSHNINSIYHPKW